MNFASGRIDSKKLGMELRPGSLAKRFILAVRTKKDTDKTREDKEINILQARPGEGAEKKKAPIVKDTQAKQTEKSQLAYIPKDVKDAGLKRVKL